MDKENILRLLIIDESQNDAEQLTSRLRNAGFAVRSHSAEDEDELKQLLQEQPLDLALCAIESEEPTLAQLLQSLQRAQQPVPVLALAHQLDPELQVEVMTAGARDLVSREAPEHLELVVRRELASLNDRRRLQWLEKAMRESERRCHSLLDSSRDAITYVHEGMHIYANSVYLEMFGFSSLEDIEGMPIMDMVAPQDHGTLKDFLRQYSKGEDDTRQLEVVGLRPDRGTFNALMEFSQASIDGEPCTQIIIRDRADNKELEKKLQFLSKQDLLTGLYNRQYFIEAVEQEVLALADGSGQSAILFIEPDNFRAVKESVGIAGSDLVLSDIANLLRSDLGDSAVAARFADNTFAVLLPRVEPAAAQAQAEKIRTAVENHISDVSGTSVTTTCSIGLSLIGEGTDSGQTALSSADLACEMARKKGGNQVHLHNPVTDEKAGKERDQEWVQLIREALEADRFVLVYQPIASLHGESAEKYEVLLRMKDKEGKEILPGQFIPVAEQSGMMAQVDRWVIARAIEIQAERRKAKHDTVLFIKISGETLEDETLLPWISQELKKARLEGDSLVFELAESVAVSHLKAAKAFAQGLKELRCGLGLEHFGSGTNSLQLLKHLPADYLKIHGSFMHNLANDKENQAMVKSITEMAHSLGKSTIANMVEDANSLAVLWQCGVNYIQGHFLQEPNANMAYDFQSEEA